MQTLPSALDSPRERPVRAVEVADYLGMSPRWVMDRFNAGDLPGLRLPGGQARFYLSDIIETLREGGP
jgi:predicted DNA-binding transcriptional regulator AlpA